MAERRAPRLDARGRISSGTGIRPILIGRTAQVSVTIRSAIANSTKRPKFAAA